jgi:RNA-directed DNA polymerase
MTTARSVSELVEQLREGQLEGDALTWAEELSLRQWARHDAQQMQRSIRRLVERGAYRNARRAVRQHNKRLSVRLNALFVASRRHRWMPKLATSAEREAIRRQRLVDVLAALPEAGCFNRPARASRFFKAKPNGGTRSLIKFDWVDDARLRILNSALTPFADLHGSQFLLRQNGHRGPASVRESLLQALREAGDDHVFLQFDIRDFYGSISHAWLEENLYLEKGIVRRFVHTGEMLIVTLQDKRTGRRKTADASTENGQSGYGIPQGSALSSLVAEQVMAHVLRSDAVFARVRLFAWSDNLGALVPRNEALAVEELVRSAFERHGAGPFGLTVERTSTTSEFKFLGVWYRVKDGTPRAYIPDEVADRWETDVCRDILTADADQLKNIVQRVLGKHAAWKWWSGIEPRVRSISARVWSAADAIEAEQLRSAA